MSACPVADETCTSCARCVGGQFIPVDRMPPCTCEGTDCDNADHRERYCPHGLERGSCPDCAMEMWADRADEIAKEGRDAYLREEARNAHR